MVVRRRGESSQFSWHLFNNPLPPSIVLVAFVRTFQGEGKDTDFGDASEWKREAQD